MSYKEAGYLCECGHRQDEHSKRPVMTSAGIEAQPCRVEVRPDEDGPRDLYCGCPEYSSDKSKPLVWCCERCDRPCEVLERESKDSHGFTDGIYEEWVEQRSACHGVEIYERPLAEVEQELQARANETCRCGHPMVTHMPAASSLFPKGYCLVQNCFCREARLEERR